MSPRTGRPKSENSMRERVTVRLDKETSKILKEYCEKHNTDKAAAIREGIRKLG
ncbi:ribbon-helix-helix protein, CopG family [Anaerofustis stercorihominis]|uniref:ribbon-helix-helix protein, CopG family n=1 Tax=Anaerofustis stercorihominis TaxID=214853 RepID=UPI00214B5DD0|nr:ribbon-helix-helix protein, CopG family [Anaerofustis stercorihominis]MCR2032841.1 ribbon-helix-helix protein, CopG family [Anaerofustis stercorihominis]